MTAVKTTSTFVLVRDEHGFKEVPLLTVPVFMVYGLTSLKMEHIREVSHAGTILTDGDTWIWGPRSWIIFFNWQPMKFDNGIIHYSCWWSAGLWYMYILETLLRSKYSLLHMYTFYYCVPTNWYIYNCDYSIFCILTAIFWAVFSSEDSWES